MAFNWDKLLKELNDVMLAMEDDNERIDQSRRASGWLGNPPAAEEQIASLERRIGKQLPASYRSFLAISNGWSNLSPFTYELWPAEKVCWYIEYDEDAAKSFSISSMDDELDNVNVPGIPNGTHATNCLALSAYDDGIILLNPRVQDDAGEWEAWFMAHWVPGAESYPSFWALMEKSLKDNLYMLNPPVQEDFTPLPTPPPDVQTEDAGGNGAEMALAELRQSMSYMVTPTIGSLLYKRNDLEASRKSLQFLYTIEVKERHMVKLRELAKEYTDTPLATAIEEFLETYPKVKRELDEQP